MPTPNTQTPITPVCAHTNTYIYTHNTHTQSPSPNPSRNNKDSLNSTNVQRRLAQQLTLHQLFVSKLCSSTGSGHTDAVDEAESQPAKKAAHNPGIDPLMDLY